ncbi:MAG: class I SAM-dependent methyltransferase [archaeon]
MVISKRYLYDKKPIICLNSIQKKTKKDLENKIKLKEYEFEKVNCVCCNNTKFDVLSEKDRYGLWMKTVICQNCGLIQTNPRMNQKSYNKFYNSLYRKLYVGSLKPTEYFFKQQTEKGKKIINFIEKNSNIKLKNKNILEIGTGAGGILYEFKKRGNEVLGIDLGSEYVSFGKKKGLNLKVGTLNILDKNIKADIIIYSHVFEHTLNPIRELIDAKKMLKPTGIIYIEVPGVKNINKNYDMDFLRYLQNAHTYHFTKTTLANILSKLNLKMLNGTEEIKCIVINSKEKKQIKNDYFITKKFLKNNEYKRLILLPYLKIKYLIIKSTINLLKRTFLI